MSFAAAKAALLERARSVAERESVDLALAFGRVLAESLVSTLTVPPFSNAAMDGYALRAADVPRAGARLPVRGRAAAGDPPGVLPPGAAARIFAPRRYTSSCFLMVGTRALRMLSPCFVRDMERAAPNMLSFDGWPSSKASKSRERMLSPDDIAHAVRMLVLQEPNSFISEVVIRPTMKP
jgi:hypothetical protein